MVVAGISIVVLNKTKEENGPEGGIKTEAEKIMGANRAAIQQAEEEIGGQIKPISGEDHILGRLGAPVQLIVYSDFECPFCADFSDTVRQVMEEFGDKVVVAFRHFPLTATNYNAMPAAIASECADEQGKFWEMHDKLFADSVNRKFNINQFKKNADVLGLDAVQFNECLDAEKYREKVEAQKRDGKNAGILGAPQSYVNGQPLPGAYQFEDFTDSQGHERTGMKNIILKHLEKNNK